MSDNKEDISLYCIYNILTDKYGGLTLDKMKDNGTFCPSHVMWFPCLDDNMLPLLITRNGWGTVLPVIELGECIDYYLLIRTNCISQGKYFTGDNVYPDFLSYDTIYMKDIKEFN